MSKFTDAVRNTLISYFNAGDQPTEAQFTALITKIQEGIEEHEHDGTGDGDGVSNLVGPVGIGIAPSRLLHVWGGDAGADPGWAGTDLVLIEHSGSAYIQFFVPAANQAGVLVADPGGRSQGGFIYDHAGEFLELWSGGSARVHISAGTGRVGIRVSTMTGQLHVDQPTNDAAIPVLVLDQADVSEGFINFIGADQGVIDEGTSSAKSVLVELGGVVYKLALYA